VKFCFLFRKTAAQTVTLLKETFKDVHMDEAGFADVAEVQRELLVALDSIFTENFIQNFQQLEQCWD